MVRRGEGVIHPSIDTLGEKDMNFAVSPGCTIVLVVATASSSISKKLRRGVEEELAGEGLPSLRAAPRLRLQSIGSLLSLLTECHQESCAAPACERRVKLSI